MTLKEKDISNTLHFKTSIRSPKSVHYSLVLCLIYLGLRGAASKPIYCGPKMYNG